MKNHQLVTITGNKRSYVKQYIATSKDIAEYIVLRFKLDDEQCAPTIIELPVFDNRNDFGKAYVEHLKHRAMSKLTDEELELLGLNPNDL